MNILVVNWLDLENPQSGGAEVHLHRLFGILAQRGHSVTVLVSGWPGAAPNVQVDGMDIHRTGGRYSFSIAAPHYYRRTLKDRHFHVVVEDLNKVPVFAPFWAGAPVALLVHHLFGKTAFAEASFPLAAATWLLERPIPRVFRSSPTVSVSESTADDLVRRGMSREHITVIPNGIDLEEFTPLPDGSRFDEPTLLFMGRLKKYKGIDLLLRVAARLRDRGVACRLLVAGKGDYGDELRKLNHRLDLNDSVQFMGQVGEGEKLDLLRRSWVHLLTSPKEGWGIANIEAAACGTPTVASDSPGLRDSVIDGETGFLVPHGEIDALADRVETLLNDEALRRQMGGACRAFSEGLSWERSAERMEAFLRDAVVSNGP